MALDFGLIDSGLFPTSDVSGVGLGTDYSASVIWNDVGIGIVPIGSIIAWNKTLAGTPPLIPSFVECNGQVLADGESPLDGQTIPDLNSAIGANKGRFLRGDTSSGTEQATQNKSHRHSATACDWGNQDGTWGQGNGSFCATSYTSYDGGDEARPPAYTIVWIIRIK